MIKGAPMTTTSVPIAVGPHSVPLGGARAGDARRVGCLVGDRMLPSRNGKKF